MDDSQPQTPWHLWAVGLLAMFLHGWGTMFGAWFLFTGGPSTAVDFLWLPALAAGTFGGIALLLRRREARSLFVVSAAIGLASLGFLFMPTSSDQPGPMIVAVNGLMLAAGAGLLLLYARAMVRRGVLR